MDTDTADALFWISSCVFVSFSLLTIVVIFIYLTFTAIYYAFVQDCLTAPSILLLVSGCIIIFIVVVFCRFDSYDNTFFKGHMWWSIILFVTFAMQIPAIVLSFSKADELGNFLDNRLNETLIESGYNTEYFEAWDLLQRNLKCCGIFNSNDWNISGFNIPPSCCDKDLLPGQYCVNLVYPEGCRTALKNTVTDATIGIGVLTIIFVVIECGFMSFWFYLTCKQRWSYSSF